MPPNVPPEVNLYNASNEPCDMAIGPCSCGATHYGEMFGVPRDHDALACNCDVCRSFRATVGVQVSLVAAPPEAQAMWDFLGRTSEPVTVESRVAALETQLADALNRIALLEKKFPPSLR